MFGLVPCIKCCPRLHVLDPMLSCLGLVCMQYCLYISKFCVVCKSHCNLYCSETDIFLLLTTGQIVFPASLQHYVTESALQKAFLQCLGGHSDLCVTLAKPATIGFYRDLHQYLRQWPPARSASKTAIGTFYLLIDVNFQTRMSSRPSNIYSFVQRVIGDSSKLPSEAMHYGIDNTVQQLKSLVSGYQNDLEAMAQKVTEQQKELEEMKRQMDMAKSELTDSRSVLSDVTNNLKTAVKQRDRGHKKAHEIQDKLEAAYLDSEYYEEEMLAKVDDLNVLIDSLKSEMISPPVAGSAGASDSLFCFETKEGGRVYSTAIRELYYKLLADGLSPARIASTIRSVLKTFYPFLDVDKLKLPGESCASYMRREELTTVNLAHNSTKLAESDCLHLNCDGTTLYQKKLQGAAINRIVLSVNEVADGSSDSMIADISRELQKLRDVAHALRLPNADKINWTIIRSSSSDSASTQKRFNKLVEERIEEDYVRFGPVSDCPDLKELVENFCCMHLAVNLRKAFFNTEDSSSDNASSDVLVHEFCKLLSKNGSKHGTPEYCHGASAFPDFLALKSDSSQSNEARYYQKCKQIKMDRQVGSRYFVTAANSGKVLFLRQAAIDFLSFTGKEKGNKLEQTVYQKLHEPAELAHLKADAIMFHHVYSNLVMLAKSTMLDKNVLEMNNHYLELQVFLSEVEKYPETALDANVRVFPSEERLYGEDRKLNHRLHPSYDSIEDVVFSRSENDEDLFRLLASGASKMNAKLSSYAENQLPGGRYWDPEPDVRSVLKSLKPNNDLCESILGLNDHLSIVMPNLHQMSKSNLVQARKNKTTKWLDTLPNDQQRAIVDLARQNRRQVKEDYQRAEDDRCKFRREKMIREKNRRDTLQKRAAEEKERLTKIHVVTSVEELKSVLSEIDEESISTAKKGQKKRALLKEQIKIRKTVYRESINIPFTTKGKQRPLSYIIRELSTHLQCLGDRDGTESVASRTTHSYTSEALVGRTIMHKFEVDKAEKWFSGVIISYNPNTHLHEIAYDGEEQHCFFNLQEDLAMDDLIINAN